MCQSDMFIFGAKIKLSSVTFHNAVFKRASLNYPKRTRMGFINGIHNSSCLYIFMAVHITVIMEGIALLLLGDWELLTDL